MALSMVAATTTNNKQQQQQQQWIYTEGTDVKFEDNSGFHVHLLTNLSTMLSLYFRSLVVNAFGQQGNLQRAFVRAGL